MTAQKRKYQQKIRAENQRQTRERIVQATMELHEEIGPAKTTVSEIARRANVQRLTVYNHFSDDGELFRACQAHWMTLHPLPDLSSVLALPDPLERMSAVLLRTYGWYRETAPMAEKIQRDRGALPSLDALMTQTADARLAELTDALADGLRARGRRADRQRALLRLALDFWTWQRLQQEGLDDGASSKLMTNAVVSAT